MTRRNCHVPSRGFTLIEMLVVLTLFGLIMAVITTLFTKGTQVYRHGESHIELQRSGRHIASRITPYLSTVYNAENPRQDPIRIPSGVNPLAEAPFVRFLTTEDWLAPVYPTPLTSSLLATGTQDLRRFVYEIGLDEEQDLTLRRIAALLPGEEEDEALGANNPIVNFPPTDTRVIVRSKNRNAENPEVFEDREGNPAFGFTYIRRNLLMLQYSISKNTRGATNQEMRITEPFRITFNLPAKTINRANLPPSGNNQQ